MLPWMHIVLKIGLDITLNNTFNIALNDALQITLKNSILNINLEKPKYSQS